MYKKYNENIENDNNDINYQIVEKKGLGWRKGEIRFLPPFSTKQELIREEEQRSKGSIMSLFFPTKIKVINIYGNNNSIKID